MSDAPASRPRTTLDHIVVAANTLAEGAAWCEETFGVAAETGGRHAAMGTHNLLLAISSAQFPKSYLEIIAIDPEAPPPGRRRWFDLDTPALRSLVASGPRLVHWVARTDDIEAAAAMLRAHGHEAGRIVDAERMTPGGLLRWRIALADDGTRAAAGAIPLLIEWGPVHPTDSMPPSGVAIEAVQLGGVEPELASLLGALARSGDAPPLVTILAGCRGSVTLAVAGGSAASPGLVHT